MKILSFITALTLAFSLNAQDITGDWSGEIDFQGQNMTLMFHFSEDNNEYSGTMDIPNQGALGIPIEVIKLNENKLSLEMMGGTFRYEGVVENESIIGALKQGGKELDLNLKKIEMTKPGNINLPSSEKELNALAAKEMGNYKYEVEDYFAKPTSSSFKLSPNGDYLSFRKKDENLKNHV